MLGTFLLLHVLHGLSLFGCTRRWSALCVLADAWPSIHEPRTLKVSATFEMSTIFKCAATGSKGTAKPACRC